MTSSIYTTFANNNTDIISRRRIERHAAGDGMAWGSESMTPREAADDMGAIVLCEYHDGMALAELSDRLYMVADVGGPWAVEVATQEDLLDNINLTAAALANLEELGLDDDDIRADVDALRTGKRTRDAFLAECLDGADEDREEGWRDYVSAVASAAGVA